MQPLRRNARPAIRLRLGTGKTRQSDRSEPNQPFIAPEPVTASSNSSGSANRKVAPSTIAGPFGYVLEGSVRKDADKVRIVAQFADERTARQFLAERCDDTNSDPWRVQYDVAGRIVTSFGGEDGKSGWRGTRTRGERIRRASRSMTIISAAVRCSCDSPRKTCSSPVKSGARGSAKFPGSSLLRVRLDSFHVSNAWNLFSEVPAADYRIGGELIRQVCQHPACRRRLSKSATGCWLSSVRSSGSSMSPKPRPRYRSGWHPSMPSCQTISRRSTSWSATRRWRSTGPGKPRAARHSWM